MWSFLEGLLALGMAWTYVFFFNRCMHRRESQSRLRFWLSTALFTGALTALSFVDMQTRYLTIGLCVLYCLFIFEADFFAMVFWCFTALVINGIADFIVTSASVQFPGITLASTIVPGVPRVICILAVNLLQLICCYVLTIRLKKSEKIRIGNGILLLSVPVLFWVLLEVLFIYIDALPPSFCVAGVPIIGGVGMLGLLMISIVLYNNLAVRERELASEKVQLRSTQLAEGHLVQMNALYTKLSSLRHDYANHLAVIAGLCEEGNLPGIETYVHDLRNIASEVCVRTGNSIIDSLISAKSSWMADHKICLDMNILLPPQLPISDVDLSILLGNLLDNAIEAAAKGWEGLERFIRLRAAVKERYWVIVCQNNAGEGTFQTTDAMPSTKTADGLHGIGTRQITSIAAKTGGFVSFSQENAVFSATVMLMFPKKKGDNDGLGDR